jgi:hypothetical protein
MAKKRISSVDLCWLIREQMIEGGASMDNVTFAVVPDPKEGWRVALGERSRKGMTPQRAQQLAAIQKRLRKTHTLLQ